jgi:hypothetical protein
MRGDANNAIEAASELPAGAGCQEKQHLPAKGKVFLLDIPFYRTRQDAELDLTYDDLDVFHPWRK